MSIKELQTDQQPIEVQQLQARFMQIENELIVQTPDLPVALAEIHKQLQQQEELVHLLDDEDCQKLHKSFEIFKQFALIQKTAKTNSKKKKLTENDLMNI
jgi:hypothetical protein